jgi:hypothetical protein
MITGQDLINRLTDYFAKDPNSNIGKLMGIFAEQFAELEETQERMRDWRSIDSAEGVTLDRIGTNVVQPRGPANDEVYRILIKSKIARNLSTGDINTIIRVLSVALDADPSAITIHETYNDLIDPEPAGISIIQVPLDQINLAGMSPSQFARIVQRTVAAGVRVGVIELTGTFEIGSIVDDFDVDKGFSDVDGIDGGLLGYALVPEDDPDLPI